MITLASGEFRVLLPILPTSLWFLRIFGFVGVAWCCDRFTHVQPLYWVLGFFGVSQGYGCVGFDRCDD